jgi:beta-glucanase (GH16 family)
MYTRFTKVLILFVVGSATVACNNQETTHNTDHSTNSEHHTASMTKDTYQAGEGWLLVWADEFNGDTLSASNWNRQVVKAGRFNEEWQRYTDSPTNAYIENGQLVIQAVHESDTHGLDQYTSARLNTAGKRSWKYGKIAARIKLPYGKGIWPAFWMLGANIDENGGDTPWPQCGEIDILELYGTKDDAVVEVNAHYAGTDGQHAQMGAADYNLPTGKFADDFHVFELGWTAEKLVWSVDGEAFATLDITGEAFAEFHEEFFLLLNVAVGGTFAGRPDETTPFPQYMYVDWVRVYQQAG